MAVVDYLGLLELHGAFDRHDLKIAAISRTFKRLAHDTNTAIVLLVQLNRSADRENRTPKPSHGGESKIGLASKKSTAARRKHCFYR